MVLSGFITYKAKKVQNEQNELDEVHTTTHFQILGEAGRLTRNNTVFLSSISLQELDITDCPHARPFLSSV